MESLNECECELGIASLLLPKIYHGFFDDIEPSEFPAAPVLNLPELLRQPLGDVLDDTELETFVSEQKSINKTQSVLRR